MSTVVGVKHNGKVYMGAESQSGSDQYKNDLSTPKVWEHGDFLYGYCGPTRNLQALQYSFDLPRNFSDNAVPLKWMCLCFTKSLRKILKEQHIDKFVGSMLVAHKSGELFEIGDDLYVLSRF